MITPLRKHVSENEERAVLQLRQKKHGLHDRAAENNDMAILYYMNYWRNRRICSSIRGMPLAENRRRYYSDKTGIS